MRPSALLLAAAAAIPAAATLYDSLSTVRFLNSGTVRASDSFEWYGM